MAVGTTVLVLAPAALSEEALFRGVPLVLLAGALGRGTAVVVVSIAFALAHFVNPNVTMLGIGNIALAGIFLGLAFYAPGGHVDGVGCRTWAGTRYSPRWTHR